MGVLGLIERNLHTAVSDNSGEEVLALKHAHKEYAEDKKEQPGGFAIILLNPEGTLNCDRGLRTVKGRNALFRDRPAYLSKMIADTYRRRTDQSGVYKEEAYLCLYTASKIPFLLSFFTEFNGSWCHHLVSVRNRKTDNAVCKPSGSLSVS